MKFIDNLSIKYKIWLAFSVVLFILVMQGVRSLNSINQMSDSFYYIANQSQPALLNATSLESCIEAVASGLGLIC